jgi:diaminopimelate epimerase
MSAVNDVKRFILPGTVAAAGEKKYHNGMKYELVIADPAKNITVFVLNPVADRIAAARELLADKSLGAEQVGFVSPPDRAGGIWRLRMMGGEFCGNAARSFGLFAAREQGLSGSRTIGIGMSGAAETLPVRVHVEEGRAAVEIPGPLAVENLNFEGRSLWACVFDGITHLVVPDLYPDKKTCARIRAVLEAAWPPPAALGFLFYDTAAAFMRPAVYVYATDSLVFESSCGSGSAALALWLQEQGDGDRIRAVRQPGGIIEVEVRRRDGRVQGLSIGGPVGLSGRIYR